jgi:hypothetical protein
VSLLDALLQGWMATLDEEREGDGKPQRHKETKVRKGREGETDVLDKANDLSHAVIGAAIAAIHVAQAMSYLHALDLPLAVIINFKVPVLRDGIKRVARFR